MEEEEEEGEEVAMVSDDSLPHPQSEGELVEEEGEGGGGAKKARKTPKQPKPRSSPLDMVIRGTGPRPRAPNNNHGHISIQLTRPSLPPVQQGEGSVMSAPGWALVHMDTSRGSGREAMKAHVSLFEAKPGGTREGGAGNIIKGPRAMSLNIFFKAPPALKVSLFLPLMHIVSS